MSTSPPRTRPGPARPRLRPRLREVSAAGARLHVAEWGRDEGQAPLLLLHGLANRWQAVAPLVPDLAEDWHIIAPDLRGHGRSARAEPYSVATIAADVMALMSAWSLAPAVIYGHSLGGLVALLVAAGEPAAVQAVAVGDSAVLTHHGPGGRAGGAAPPRPGPPIASGGPRLPRGVDPAVMDAFHDGRLLEGYDGRRVLPRIQCPVLLLQAAPELGGHLDDLQSRRALALLPRGELVAVPGVGHHLQLFHRTAVLAALQPFLDRVRGQRVPAGQVLA
jgi:pimeloyl-ACP methyl ester carboxylesterase